MFSFNFILYSLILIFCTFGPASLQTGPSKQLKRSNAFHMTFSSEEQESDENGRIFFHGEIVPKTIDENRRYKIRVFEGSECSAEGEFAEGETMKKDQRDIFEIWMRKEAGRAMEFCVQILYIDPNREVVRFFYKKGNNSGQVGLNDFFCQLPILKM